MYNLPYEYIAIEGPPKAGKKIFGQKIATRINARFVPDVEENPYLQSFLSNPKDERFALLAQLVFLVERGRILLSLKQRSIFREIIITSFLLEKDKIYAFKFLKEDELLIYNKMYELFYRSIRKPEFVIFFQLTNSELLRRIEKYGTKEEKSIPPKIWKELNDEYNHFAFNYNQTPSLIIKADNLDYREKEKGISEIIEEISNTKEGKKFFFIEEEN